MGKENTPNAELGGWSALGVWFFSIGAAQQIIYADAVEIGQGMQYGNGNIQSA